MAKNRQNSIADFLLCASVLEEKTFRLYKNLSDKVDAPLVHSLLLYIAHDSQKHSAILKGIGESISKSEKTPKDCKKRFADTGATIDRLQQEIAEEGRTNSLNIPSLVKKLTVLESAFGEEYYSLVQLKTLEYMEKEIRVNYAVEVEDLKSIFETIIRDEGLHSELLARMKEILSAEEEKKEPKAPMVKYTHPDSWSRAMPGSFYENTT
jgi:rubrerythrin